ncbi:MAG: hypothetical protein Q9160_002050 [Pyrenula sp. 1 TL-2023]
MSQPSKESLATKLRVPESLASDGRTFPSDQSLKKILDTGRYSDMIVKCGRHTWHLHRAILCSQSEFFERMCESSFREATEQCVTLEDEDPFIAAHAISYLYLGRILLPEKGNDDLTYATSIRQIGQLSDIQDHEEAAYPTHHGVEWMLALLYAFGEKFLIPGMKRQAYLEFFQMHYPPVATAIETRSGDEAEELTMIGPGWLEERKEMIRAVFQTTPDSDRALRDLVILTYQIWHRVFGREKSEVMRGIFHDCPDFAFEKLRYLYEDPYTGAPTPLLVF